MSQALNALPRTKIVVKIMSVENKIMGKISREKPKIRVIRTWRNSSEDRKGSIIFAHNKELDRVHMIIKKLSEHLDDCQTCHVRMILKEVMED